MNYLDIYSDLPLCLQSPTSMSEMAELRVHDQLTRRTLRYISLRSCSRTNASFTARDSFCTQRNTKAKTLQISTKKLGPSPKKWSTRKSTAIGSDFLSFWPHILFFFFKHTHTGGMAEWWINSTVGQQAASLNPHQVAPPPPPKHTLPSSSSLKVVGGGSVCVQGSGGGRGECNVSLDKMRNWGYCPLCFWDAYAYWIWRTHSKGKILLSLQNFTSVWSIQLNSKTVKAGIPQGKRCQFNHKKTLMCDSKIKV